MTQVLIVAVGMFTKLIYTVVLIRIIFGWIGLGNRDNAFYGILCELTDPILVPFKRIVQDSPFNKAMYMIDFSPILALSFINIVSLLIMRILNTF